MKSKIYKVFACGCRSLDHARLRIGNNKFQNCCEVHGLDGPVVHKEYTCAECGLLITLEPDTRGGTHKYCPECVEAKRKRERHDRREVIRAQERRITGTIGGQQTTDEIKFLKTLNQNRLRKYFEATKKYRKKRTGDGLEIDRDVVLDECVKRLEVVG